MNKLKGVGRNFYEFTKKISGSEISSKNEEFSVSMTTQSIIFYSCLKKLLKINSPSPFRSDSLSSFRRYYYRNNFFHKKKKKAIKSF
jgi:hypothetical protein